MISIFLIFFGCFVKKSFAEFRCPIEYNKGLLLGVIDFGMADKKQRDLFIEVMFDNRGKPIIIFLSRLPGAAMRAMPNWSHFKSTGNYIQSLT